MANAQPPEFPRNSSDQSYDGEADWTQGKLTLLHEIAVRFPDSAHYSDAIETLIAPESYGWSSSIPVEPFRAAFEAALNVAPSVEISTTTLTAFIAKQFHQNTIEVVQVLPADNILGDGAPGWVLDVRASYGYGTVFALAGKTGTYRLISPRTDWRLFSWSDQAVFSYDLNANGVPEIAIWDSYWGTGMTHYCEEDFALFEWNGHGFADLAPNIETDANTDSGGCSGFEIVAGPKGTQAITTGNWIDVGCSSGDYFGVGNLIMKRRYEWNGTFFALAGNEVLPLEASMPEGDPINQCTLSWVNEAGAANDQAFQLLPTLLAEINPTLTTGFEGQFGPAYLDFFRFKLGTWYAMRGRKSHAITLLTQVRDAPANPNFDAAARLAEAFLGSYSDTGAYAGCVAADRVLNIYAFQGSDPLYLDVSAMREAWGFSDWQWGVGGGSIFSGPTLREDPMNLCSRTTAFRLTIQKETFQNTESLTRWLAQRQILYTGLEEGDVDGDGRRDWLILVGTGEEESLHFWVLLNKGGFILPLWVSNIHRTTENIPATWDTFKPNPRGDLLNVYQWTDGMVIFRVVSQNGWTGIEVVRQSIGYYQGESFLGFTIQPVENDARKHDDVAEIKILTVGEKSWEPDWYTLSWDPAFNTLRVVASPQYNQDQQVQLVESLLFDKANPIAATEVISQLLSTDNKLLDSDMTKYGALPRVQPYLHYLQGLAYEMSGEEQWAINAYWTLWHDFPIHPLSYVAQQKLEKRKP